MHRLPDQIDPAELINLLIVGRSGVGKTHALAALDGLWVFTHEADAVPVIRAQNKNARIYLLEDNIESFAKVKELLLGKHQGCSGGGCAACRHTGLQAAADGCRVVLYESLSEAQRICLQHAWEVNNKRRKLKLPEGAFDELDYNLSYTYLTRLLTVFRSVPLPTIQVAHAQDPEPAVSLPSGEQAKYVRWAIPGKKFDAKIPRYFTAIGAVHHRLGPPEERAVVFDPTVLWAGRMFRVKSMAGLRGIEGTDARVWLRNIRAALAGGEIEGEVPKIEAKRMDAPPEEPEPPSTPSPSIDPSTPKAPAFDVPA